MKIFQESLDRSLLSGFVVAILLLSSPALTARGAAEGSSSVPCPFAGRRFAGLNTGSGDVTVNGNANEV